MSATSTARGAAFVSISLLALLAAGAAARAGDISSSLPETGTAAISGPAFQIINIATGSSTVAPSAVKGIAAGPKSRGVVGIAQGRNSIGVFGNATKPGSAAIYGLSSGEAGYAGYFELDNPYTKGNQQSAVYAVNRGGDTQSFGQYGPAGDFEITNAMNSSTALTAATPGPGIAMEASSGKGTGIYASGLRYGVEAYSPGFGGAGAGVSASSDVGPGVIGTSNSGIGLEGDTNSGFGVYGTSVTGTAAYFREGNGSYGYDGGAGWSCTSDRNAKEDFHAVDVRDTLRRLAAMPVFNYRMKQQRDPAERWLGPTAQDFKAAFGLGENDTTINTADAQGVALAAIKGLYAELQDRDAKIAAQDAKIAALEERMTKFEAMSAQMVPGKQADATR